MPERTSRSDTGSERRMLVSVHRRMPPRHTAINPYKEILGLDCGVRPTHYELLGLAPFETELSLIEKVAPKQSASSCLFSQ